MLDIAIALAALYRAPLIAVTVGRGLPVAARQVFLHALDDAHLQRQMQCGLNMCRQAHNPKSCRPQARPAHHEARLAANGVRAGHCELVNGLNAKVHRQVRQSLEHAGVNVVLADATLPMPTTHIVKNLPSPAVDRMVGGRTVRRPERSHPP